MRDPTRGEGGLDSDLNRLDDFLLHEDDSFDIFEVRKEDENTAEKISQELAEELDIENLKDCGIGTLRFGDFDVVMQPKEDVIEMGGPLVCRFCIASEIFKVADIHLEIRIDGTIVDSFDQKQVKCDIEHEIEVLRPEVAGDGEILILTSPPGSESGSKWREKFVVKAVEPAGDDTAELSASEVDAEFPGGFSEEDVMEMKEIKEMASEWQKWKNGVSMSNGDVKDPDLNLDLPEKNSIEPNPAILEADIYQDVLKIVDRYMEKAEKFVGRQLSGNIKATPDTLALDNIKDLAECMGRSASLIIGKEKALKMKDELLNLRSLYLFSSYATSEEGKIL